jgi:hypothetical protein
MQGDVMSQVLRHRVAEENIALFGGEADPELTAVRVAIQLEDALGVTVPAELLDAAHLGTPEAVAATLDLLLGPA